MRDGASRPNQLLIELEERHDPVTGEAARSTRPGEGLVDVAVTPLGPERLRNVLPADSLAGSSARSPGGTS
jgi:hypothetical protein